MQAAELLGYAAGFLTTFSAAPQLYHSYTTGDVRGISLAFQMMLAGGLLLWTIYGLLIRVWPVVLFNAVGCALWTPLLIKKVGEKRRAGKGSHS